MFSPEERQRAVGLYSATPMTTAQVVEHLGHPTRQCLERWPAKDPGYAGHMAKPIILMETRAKAIEPVPGGMRQKRAAERLGAGVGTVRNRVRAYREGDMAALRPENRDTGQADKLAMRRDRSAGDAEAPRRRVEEPELGERGDAGGGGGVRRFQRQVRVPQGQGRAPNPRLGEGAPQDHGRGWSDGACSRTTRVRLMRGRGHAGSRQPHRPRFHGWDAEREMARGHHPRSRPGTGRACLSPPVGCHDGRIVACTAGSGPDAGLADRMLVKAAETLPKDARPLVHSDRGCHCR